mgnify:CR=1 FL=1
MGDLEKHTIVSVLATTKSPGAFKVINYCAANKRQKLVCSQVFCQAPHFLDGGGEICCLVALTFQPQRVNNLFDVLHFDSSRKKEQLAVFVAIFVV